MNDIKIATALTLAGFDPSGGAGLQADLKTFQFFGVYGMSVATLIASQNTQGVQHIDILNAQTIQRQLDAILEDIPPTAIKVGALGNAECIQLLQPYFHAFKSPLVVDPVFLSKNNSTLLDTEAINLFRSVVIPNASLITPNLAEAEMITSKKTHTLDEMKERCKEIHALGAESVLIKGGHLNGDATDVLYDKGTFHLFPQAKIQGPARHGTGCALSSAITAGLALGESLLEAVEHAKKFITSAIQTAPQLGQGNPPLNFNPPYVD